MSAIHRFSSGYAVAHMPAPLLDVRSTFQDAFCYPLCLDDQGLLIDRHSRRPLEAIALTGAKFKILQDQGNHTFRVMTEDYPGEVLVDKRFLTPVEEGTSERQKVMPSMDEILQFLKKEEEKKSAYIWGGNDGEGIEKMLEFYPPGAEIDQMTKIIWTLKGYDCSGLFYRATNGSLPRNTSQLLPPKFSMGKCIPISGCNAEEIAAQVQPLDFLVYPGHVISVFDEERTIESRVRLRDGGRGGVVFDQLVPRIEEMMQTRQPVDDWASLTDEEKKHSFLSVRWHPETVNSLS